MGYSSEGSIGGWGAKYRAYIGASTSNNTATSCDVYLTGGGQLYLVDGWSGSSMSFSGKSNLSGNCAGGSGQASWSNSNWYYGSFKYGTINKTHSAQTLTYYCSFNFGGAGTVTASASVTISAKTSYTVSFNANSGSGAPSNQTKWHGETLTLSGTKPTRSGYDFLGWATSSTGTVAYSAGGSYTANSGATLYAVWKPQASTVTSVTDITLGNAPTVTWTPLLDTFKYKITYSIGSWSYTTDFIVPGSTSEQTYNSYTIPTTVANQITSASTGVITCLLETYDADDTLLGSNSKTFTATVPTILKPTLTATLTPTGDNATVNSWGIYVAGYSKVRCQATGTAQQGATIVSVQITGTANANSTTSSIDYTTGVLTAGTKPFTFTVTDSRGMTSTAVTQTATFMSYSAPEITSFNAHRKDAPNITVVRALATWTWTDIGNNTITKSLQYRQSSASSWTNVSGTISSGTTKTLSEIFTDSVSYYLKLTITDSLNNASIVTVYIPTIFVWEHMPPNGQGVAFGKTSETGNFEVNYPMEVYDDVSTTGMYLGSGSVEYIKGTQTASTNAWTGVTKDKALYDGKMIMYVLPYAGTSTGATLNLTLAGGGTSGAKNIYRYGATTAITTHYAAGSRILLIYDSANNRWNSSAWYNSNLGAMSQTEADTGTATTNRGISAAVLQNKIITSTEYLQLARLLAEPFSASEAYVVGEFCIYPATGTRYVYECKTAGAAAWNASRWTQLGTYA